MGTVGGKRKGGSKKIGRDAVKCAFYRAGMVRDRNKMRKMKAQRVAFLKRMRKLGHMLTLDIFKVCGNCERNSFVSIILKESLSRHYCVSCGSKAN